MVNTFISTLLSCIYWHEHCLLLFLFLPFPTLQFKFWNFAFLLFGLQAWKGNKSIQRESFVRGLLRENLFPKGVYFIVDRVIFFPHKQAFFKETSSSVSLILGVMAWRIDFLVESPHMLVGSYVIVVSLVSFEEPFL